MYICYVDVLMLSITARKHTQWPVRETKIKKQFPCQYSLQLSNVPYKPVERDQIYLFA